MIPKQVIEKAHEGGFTGKAFNASIWWQVTACKPEFWQALGKALGWEEEVCWGCGKRFLDGYMTCQTRNCKINEFASNPIPYWRFVGKRFYDLILTGGDTGKFWEEILK